MINCSVSQVGFNKSFQESKGDNASGLLLNFLDCQELMTDKSPAAILTLILQLIVLPRLLFWYRVDCEERSSGTWMIKDRNASLADPRSAAVSLFFSILTVVVSITQVMVVDTESSVRTSMVSWIRTDEFTFGFIFSSEAVDFTIASPWVRDAFVSALEARKVQYIGRSYCRIDHRRHHHWMHHVSTHFLC